MFDEYYDEDYDRFYEADQYISLQEECLEEIWSGMKILDEKDEQNQ